MDYHFVVPKTTPRKRSLPLPLLVIPIFVLSAVLPFFLAYVISPSALNFSSTATERPELRIWFTPSRIAAHPGENVVLTVKASYDGSEQLVPSIRVQFDSDSVDLGSTSIFYQKPFRGEVTLGTVTVTPKSVGSAVVTIPKDSVRIDPPIGEIDLFVSSANFVVK